jgi:hypothetical protein
MTSVTRSRQPLDSQRRFTYAPPVGLAGNDGPMTEAVGFGASIAFLAALLNLLNRRWSLTARLAVLGAVVIAIAVAVWATRPSGRPF